MKEYGKDEKDDIGIIVAKMKKPPSMEDDEDSEEMELQKSCAKDVLDAIEKKDVDAFLEAFKQLIECCK